MRLFATAAGIALGVGLWAPAACSPSPSQTPSAAEPEQGWRDRPLTAGNWVYRGDARGSLALYGPANAEAAFVVRCELPARRIVFSREGRLSDEGTMSFTPTAGARGYPAQNGASDPPYVVAATGANDGWLDELAFTRGRFAVATPGQPTLVLPSWPQMVRVFEDCRG